jgi:hypothetical protein
MRVLGDRTDDAVRSAVEQWVTLLADTRFADALAMLAPSEQWKPELLATVVCNYGFVEPRGDGKTFTVTPLASATGVGPRFDVSWFDKPVGSGWASIVGDVHYDLPLNGAWSDVTAIFNLVDTEQGLVLALDDVHVM